MRPPPPPTSAATCARWWRWPCGRRARRRTASSRPAIPSGAQRVTTSRPKPARKNWSSRRRHAGHLLEHGPGDAPGNERAGHERPADPADAAEEPEGQQRQGEAALEARGRDHHAGVGQQHPRQCRRGTARTPAPSSLVRATSMPAAAAAALVGPHGQHATTGGRAADVGHHHHRQRGERQATSRRCAAGTRRRPSPRSRCRTASAWPPWPRRWGPVNQPLRNTSCWAAMANASVTMASWTPRMRVAGQLTSMPAIVVTARATSGAHGMPHPMLGGQLGHQEAGDALERELRQRDLPEVAGEHHLREHQHGGDHGRDQRAGGWSGRRTGARAAATAAPTATSGHRRFMAGARIWRGSVSVPRGGQAAADQAEHHHDQQERAPPRRSRSSTSRGSS